MAEKTVDMNDGGLLELISTRRSIRKYTDEAVPREKILRMLEAGRCAPSGKNNQPFRFLCVGADDPRMEKLAECTHYSRIVKSCSVMLGVFLDRASKYSEMKDYQAAGACLQNMWLAAHAQDLGAVWLGEIVNRPEDVCSVLGVDDSKYELMAFLAVGQPAEAGKCVRKPLEELMLEDF
ncbi:nitroreductase [Desulfobaculum bizertense]|uniref:nitroreductase family protein n=1 Tax=Desulfobaculum bizertense TaxID=376490 RepID=UPI001F33466E|nr:nitroreductase [Desulfobaculum bizertense]UIJ37065.1 nitroreductase [Desulfobaculum bizertense]